MSFGIFIKKEKDFAQTEEMLTQYRNLLKMMKRIISDCVALRMLTNETIYRVGEKTVKECRKSLKKVVAHGVCTYNASYNQMKPVFENMTVMISIKMHASKAEDKIDEWLQRTPTPTMRQNPKPVLHRVGDNEWEIHI
uniref:Uncharacterized protein n=3 Tax=Caenorhabditis japonica TaxID=281687 RepID=A0A8R1ED22_CAEJA